MHGLNSRGTEKLNAFNSDSYAQMANALRRVKTDDSVHVAVLSAHGPAFCAGNDIEGFIEMSGVAPVAFANREHSPAVDVVFALMEFDKPLLAAVHGFAIGWGATMLLWCDVVFVSRDAKLSFPFVDLGVVPESGSTAMLASVVGKQRAARILLGAETVDAHEALAMGIASEIVENATLRHRVDQFASNMAARSLEALVATKRLMQRPSEPLRDRVIAEFLELARLVNSSDVQDRFKRFLASRSARTDTQGKSRN